MMRFYSLNRTTTNAKWDVLLFNAKHGLVECMFYRTPAGCLSSECTFEHSTIPAVTITPPLQNMTTNNALLTPLLGFGVTATSATPCTTTSASNISSNALTAATPAGGLAPKPFIGGNSLRIPVDTTRHLAAAPVVDKPDDVMMFRDPVWGSCGTQEKRTTQQSQQQQQQQAQQQQNGVTIFWGPGERNLSETFW
ncbi:unnamed protein product [Trypanosoma congolense IL3000]|uniref:WGS project CAEQ00000000 data, annotated contig 2146 n=1 Tax=Trypanosoma congolense (strain IL3000) TaxID=1068625 RepID=F9WBV0_TRYCI|nr:unnamed protein product [Trypanosoma congolense IL3000]